MILQLLQTSTAFISSFVYSKVCFSGVEANFTVDEGGDHQGAHAAVTHWYVDPLQAPSQPLDADVVGATTSDDTPPYASSRLTAYPDCDGEATGIEAFLGNLEAGDSAANKDLIVADNHAALDATSANERVADRIAATPTKEDIVAKVPLANAKGST
ncbi:hypothetical protein L7F22_065742 [Adiantum nelumboides]|nr:hypothetical protein [Adiantum nelumboides]